MEPFVPLIPFKCIDLCCCNVSSRYPAFMSWLDLIQLHSLRVTDKYSFGLSFLSEKNRVKLLCIHLLMNISYNLETEEHKQEKNIENTGPPA